MYICSQFTFLCFNIFKGNDEEESISISAVNNGKEKHPYTSYSTGVIITDCDYVSFIKNKPACSILRGIQGIDENR